MKAWGGKEQYQQCCFRINQPLTTQDIFKFTYLRFITGNGLNGELDIGSFEYGVLLQDVLLWLVVAKRLKRRNSPQPSRLNGKHIIMWIICIFILTFLPYRHWKKITPTDHTSTLLEIFGGSLPTTKHSGGKYLATIKKMLFSVWPSCMLFTSAFSEHELKFIIIFNYFTNKTKSV